MRTLTTLCLAFVLICAGAAMASDDSLTREFDVESGGLLKLEFDAGGSAVIEGWDKDTVQITFVAGQNDIEDWEFDFNETRKGLEVKADIGRSHNRSTDLEARIMVPNRFAIKISTAGGSFSVEGVTGTFSGRTAGGSLVLHDVEGDVDLRTGGGGIRVTDSKVDGRMKTGGGKVLIKNVVGDLRATSGGGNVQYVNVRTAGGDMITPFGKATAGTTENTVMIKTAGGGIKVDEAPSGAIVQTGGGNVRVRGADKFVKASTGGGDMEIELEQGWVAAKTGAGDMEVTIERDGGKKDIVLTTGYGDVTLIVPEGFGMDLDLDLRYTRESSRDYEIDTDFDIRTDHSDDWERQGGSSNWIKHITSEDEINGGGQKVRIKTTNGNIIIKTK